MRTLLTLATLLVSAAVFAQAPDYPLCLSAVQATDTATVYFLKVPDAAAYRVYTAPDAARLQWKLNTQADAKNSTATNPYYAQVQFRLPTTPKGKWLVSVSAVDAAGKESGKSAPAEILPFKRRGWLPDGSRVQSGQSPKPPAYSLLWSVPEDAPRLFVAYTSVSTDKQSDLFLLNLAAGQPVKLTDAKQCRQHRLGTNLCKPVASPDLKWVAFLGDRLEKDGRSIASTDLKCLWIANAATRELRALTDDSFPVYDVRWSADSGSVSFFKGVDTLDGTVYDLVNWNLTTGKANHLLRWQSDEAWASFNGYSAPGKGDQCAEAPLHYRAAGKWMQFKSVTRIPFLAYRQPAHEVRFSLHDEQFRVALTGGRPEPLPLSDHEDDFPNIVGGSDPRRWQSPDERWKVAEVGPEDSSQAERLPFPLTVTNGLTKKVSHYGPLPWAVDFRWFTSDGRWFVGTIDEPEPQQSSTAERHLKQLYVAFCLEDGRLVIYPNTVDREVSQSLTVEGGAVEVRPIWP